VKNVID